MLIGINGQLVEIDEDRARNREIIRQKGEELRQKVQDARFHGEFIDSDKEVLALILKIIAHDRVYGQDESLQDRAGSLYNIVRSVTCLSDRAQQEGEPKRFKEKYLDSTERSIWRDIEFLHKLVIPSSQLGGCDNHLLPALRLNRILEEDLPVLANIISMELDDSILELEKQEMRDSYKDTKQLSNIYEIVNYYREQESFQKILRETDPSILTQINPQSIEGKLAILRILEVIGENLTQKNITPTTRHKDSSIDFNLLVGVRNKLAHHEWYLGHDNVIHNILAADLEKLLKVEIPFIREHVENLWKNNKAISELHVQNPRAYDNAISDYFVGPDYHAKISEGTKNAIQQYSQWLLDNKFINQESYNAILASLDGDMREVKSAEIIRDKIGKDKCSQEYIQSLQTPDIAKLGYVITTFNQIKGELNVDVDIERAKKLIYEFALLCGLKTEDLQLLEKRIQESMTVEQLVSYIPNVSPIARDILQVLKLQEKIKTLKKNSDEIRDLYKYLCDRDYIQHDDNKLKIDAVVADMNAKIITKNAASKAINDIKLAAINNALNASPEFQVNKNRMDVSEAYYKLRKDIKLDFEITEGLKSRIIEFCKHLKEIGWISEGNEEQITKMLKDVDALPHLSFTLKSMIGEEKFLDEYRDQLKSPELKLLEQMLIGFGKVSDLTAQDYREFFSMVRAQEEAHNQHILQYLGDLRDFHGLLPDDEKYKTLTKGKKLVEQRKVIGEALHAINLLEQIFAKLNSQAFNTLKKSYPEECRFIAASSEYSKRICNGNSEYNAAIDKLRRDTNLSNNSIPIPIPLNFRDISLSHDDVVSRTKAPIDMSKEELEDYIQGNTNFIIKETINYAHFLDVGHTLKQNPILLKAAEYAVSIIFPYLTNLQIEYLSNIPNMLQRELKAHRNFTKHGSIYADLLVPDTQEQFLVRYASTFLIEIKKQLLMLHNSFAKQIPDTYKNSDHDSWYTGDHIRELLLYWLHDEHYTVSALTVFNNSDLLHTNTVAAVNAAVAGQTVVMPIHLHGNHWVGAIVRRQADGIIQVIFNNSLGHSIELEPNALAFVQNIQAAVAQNDGSTPNIVDLCFIQQQNGDDCGAWTVDNLVRLATTQNLDDLSRDEIIQAAHLQQTGNGNAYDIRTTHNLVLENFLGLEAIPLPHYYEEPNNNGNGSNVAGGSAQGKGTLDYSDTSYWYVYTKVAIDRMLELRLKNEEIGTEHARIITPKYIFNETNTLPFVKDLVSQISRVSITTEENNKIARPKFLVPININNKHWVGMTVEFIDGRIIVTYIDSEANPMSKSLSNGLKAELESSYPDLTIEITEKEVELQKYNNCGLEVIENLIAAATDETVRIDQEDALAMHSILYEQYLIEKAIQVEKVLQEIGNKNTYKAGQDSTTKELLGTHQVSWEEEMEKIWNKAQSSDLGEKELRFMNAIWDQAQVCSTEPKEGATQQPTYLKGWMKSIKDSMIECGSILTQIQPNDFISAMNSMAKLLVGGAPVCGVEVNAPTERVPERLDMFTTNSNVLGIPLRNGNTSSSEMLSMYESIDTTGNVDESWVE
jgi:uncharacterized protein with HEPN domain